MVGVVASRSRGGTTSGRRKSLRRRRRKEAIGWERRERVGRGAMGREGRRMVSLWRLRNIAIGTRKVVITLVVGVGDVVGRGRNRGSTTSGGRKALRRRRKVTIGRERRERIGRGARGREGIGRRMISLWRRRNIAISTRKVVITVLARGVGAVVERRGGTGGSMKEERGYR